MPAARARRLAARMSRTASLRGFELVRLQLCAASEHGSAAEPDPAAKADAMRHVRCERPLPPAPPHLRSVCRQMILLSKLIRISNIWHVRRRLPPSNAHSAAGHDGLSCFASTSRVVSRELSQLRRRCALQPGVGAKYPADASCAGRTTHGRRATALVDGVRDGANCQRERRCIWDTGRAAGTREQVCG